MLTDSEFDPVLDAQPYLSTWKGGSNYYYYFFFTENNIDTYTVVFNFILTFTL